VPSRRGVDSGLEAFSRDPADGSLSPLALRPSEIAGAPLHKAGDPQRRGPGCPIRTPPDPRPPAPPRCVSPRGRVLPRPPAPRHPPCALLRGHDAVVRFAPDASDRHAPQSPRGFAPPPPCAGNDRRSIRRRIAVRRARSRLDVRRSLTRLRSLCCFRFSLLFVLSGCSMRAGERVVYRRASRGRGAWSPRASGCQGAAHEDRWVEPRGFEPRTSAVQGRRSPG
jgi:hypothetical protein